MLFSSKKALRFPYPVHNIKRCTASQDFFVTLNKSFINGTMPYEITRRGKGKKKFVIWYLAGWADVFKTFSFFFFNFDFAPVLAKNRNETSIPNRVSFHLSVVMSDVLQSVINQNLIAHTEHNQLWLRLVLPRSAGILKFTVSALMMHFIKLVLYYCHIPVVSSL